MPLLKDYIGSLVSGINQARAMADIESAKIAELYHSNALLKNFSVPRFKASNIELDIPVAIDQLDEITDLDYEPIDNKKFNSVTYSTFKNVLKVDRIDRSKSLLLTKKIAKETDALEKKLKAKEDRQAGIKVFSDNLTRFYKTNIEDEKAIKKRALNDDVKFDIAEKLNASLRTDLLSQIREPKKTIDLDNTKVLVQANQLREIAPENILRIKMTLQEDGMEWHKIENSNGDIEDRLLPE